MTDMGDFLSVLDDDHLLASDAVVPQQYFHPGLMGMSRLLPTTSLSHSGAFLLESWLRVSESWRELAHYLSLRQGKHGMILSFEASFFWAATAEENKTGGGSVYICR
jgi:hypothetical protein